MDKKSLTIKGYSVGIILLFVGIACSFVVHGDNTTGVVPVFDAETTQNNMGIPSYRPFFFDWGVDQKNIQDCGLGISLFPPQAHAQSFTPTKEKLTAVSLCLIKGIAPPDPLNITVSIRGNLAGPDLATKTIRTSDVTIKKSRTWVLFDFEDITVTPEVSYYIICSVDAGDASHAYCWMFANNDTYSRGAAWFQEDGNGSWVQEPTNAFHIMDFSFKTYFRKPFGSEVKNNVSLFASRFLWAGILHKSLRILSLTPSRNI